MKNILLVINPEHPSVSCIHFGCYLAQLTQSKLKAVFVEKHIADKNPSLKTLYGIPYVETILASDLPNYEEHQQTRKVYTETFKKICHDKGVRFSINQDLYSPLEGLIEESRFTDLIVVSRNISFEGESDHAPSRFVKDLIAETECSVITPPVSFEGIDEILFAYNDSRSSAFAIKQFSYLFPELEDIKVTLLHVQKDPDEIQIQEKKLSEWISDHYSYPVFMAMTGKPGAELFKYLFDKKKTLVVMGSYGRDMLSNLLSPSTADPLLGKLDLPFFFAHN